MTKLNKLNKEKNDLITEYNKANNFYNNEKSINLGFPPCTPHIHIPLPFGMSIDIPQVCPNVAHRNVSDAGKDRSEGIPNSKVPGGSHSTDNAIWYKAHSSPHPVDKYKLSPSVTRRKVLKLSTTSVPVIIAS